MRMRKSDWKKLSKAEFMRKWEMDQERKKREQENEKAKKLADSN